jgi:nucleoside-diphosphate-sugar epimerase
VVHCAGAVRGRDAGHFHAVNAQGVAGLVRAAETEAPGTPFLLVSSLAARRPDLSWYAASKRAGEDALVATAATLRWVVLRPPVVYGAADREVRPLLRWMARGLAPVLGPRGARFSLVHVDDLAEAALRLLDGEQTGRTFEVHDGREGGYSWADVADTVERVVGRRVVRVPVPAAALHVAAHLALAVARLGGRPPILTPGKVREVTHPDWICDNAALTRATGWRPRVSILEGLTRTLRDGEDRA